MLSSAEYIETSFCAEYHDIIPEEKLLEHVLPLVLDGRKARLKVSTLSDEDLPRIILNHLEVWKHVEKQGILIKDADNTDYLPSRQSSNPMRARRAEQLTFLREVLMEYQPFLSLSRFLLVEDEVPRELLELALGGKVSFWMILAMQTMIEIKQLLGKPFFLIH